jgi:hypothetical protein
MATTYGSSATARIDQCTYCGAWHLSRTCPRVRKIEYYPDGTVKSVELFPEVVTAAGVGNSVPNVFDSRWPNNVVEK